jgi:hypothetical protein
VEYPGCPGPAAANEYPWVVLQFPMKKCTHVHTHRLPHRVAVGGRRMRSMLPPTNTGGPLLVRALSCRPLSCAGLPHRVHLTHDALSIRA